MANPQKDAPAEPKKESANRNLALRVITALILLPIVLWLIWMGSWGFAALVAIAGAINAFEVAKMMLGDDSLRFPAAVAAFAMPFFFIHPSLGARSLHWLWAGLALVALTWRMLRDAPVDTAARDVSAVLFAGLYGSMLGYLMPLRLFGEANSWTGGGWVILACSVTWVGDTGAYFAGRFLGKHKFYPRISPSKTWEGFFGGLLSAIGSAFVVRALVLPDLTALDAALLGLIGGIGGPVGDLVESMLKRSCKVKDSGNILPGHGGMLDRVDALMFNAPLLYLYARVFVL